MEGSFLRAQPGIVCKEGEKRDLDPCIVEEPGGSEEKA